MRSQLRVSLLISVMVIVSGCMPVMIGGGMVACGYTALRDKKVGDSLNDSKIDVAIKKRLYKVDPKLFSEVSVVTNQGCVLFTGVVSNPEWGGVAEKEAWKVEGVIAVDNNITSGEELTPGQIVKDGFITSSCRSALICASGVRSVNYKIKTANGVVYITGVARTEEELNTTLSKLQNVSGVKKVVSYVNILKK